MALPQLGPACFMCFVLQFDTQESSPREGLVLARRYHYSFTLLGREIIWDEVCPKNPGAALLG